MKTRSVALSAVVCQFLVGCSASEPKPFVGCETFGDPGPFDAEIELVHRRLGLFDIRPDAGAGITAVEVESTEGEVRSFRVEASTDALRLRLGSGDRVRMVYTEGFATSWTDPNSVAITNPAAEQTPGWALGAVWYNVFPERFDNANPDNDQGWPHGTDLEWEQDWFEVTADEFEASKNRATAYRPRYSDDWDRDRPPLRETVFERRFGGDLQGVERRLGHIRDLGATVIWFCPVFDSTSLHKYDAADHRHIDPALGHPGSPTLTRPAFSTDPNTWEWTPADRYFVDEFLPAARSHGLRTVLDGVWNHVGLAHPTFRSVLSRGNDSPYASWYHFGVDATGRTNTWQAWDRRNGGLPEFRQVDGDLVPGVKEHVFAVTERWMDPNGDGDPSDGIDGWRLDVANEVGLTFWGDWRAHVRGINPEATLVGELWFDGREYFEGRAFDSQMNYPLAFPMIEWLGGALRTAELPAELDRVFAHAPATNLAQVNLLGSHDTARFVSKMMNPILDYDRGAGLGEAAYNRGRPSDEAYDKLVLAYAVLTALPGSPMIYAGDELGLWGADDPENRKPLVWPGDKALTARIADVLKLRQDAELGPVLRFGAARWWPDGEVLVVERQLGPTRVRLIANPTTESVDLEGQTIPPLSFRFSQLGETGADG
ncbi:MAG: alpha-amylase family glycosyl hydrolase [Planctomycetota bacterium]